MIMFLPGVWTTGLTWSSRADRGDGTAAAARRRHQTVFDVREKLGRGVFGRVYRVQHRLDGKEYALKVVRVKSSSKGNSKQTMEKILREVQVLSSIQSNHVVRYYSAWVERGDLSDEMICTDAEESLSEDWQTSSRSSVNDSTTLTDNNNNHNKGTEDTINNPTCNLCQSTYKDWEVTLEQWGLIDTVLQPLDLCIHCYKKSIPESVDISNITIQETNKVLAPPECLYILMEYCESTLARAIQEAGKDETMIWSLFGQIVEGFAHLHANGIIHRDVKPSNIFVHDNVVKIGDLGLATTRSHESSVTITSNKTGGSVAAYNKSSDVGTLLYMAPEVAAGQYYDEKADVYSLGLLLVEILSEFSTGMERVKVLSALREEGSLFPVDWANRHPVACNLAKRMLIHGPPSARPSCFEVLQELQLQGLCQADSTRHWVSDLQSQIRSLQNTVDLQDQEIVRLRKLLELHEIRDDPR